MKPKTCNCPAYAFPHREGSGKCADLTERIETKREDPLDYFGVRSLFRAEPEVKLTGL